MYLTGETDTPFMLSYFGLVCFGVIAVVVSKLAVRARTLFLNIGYNY